VVERVEATAAALDDFAPSDFPGRIAETSAAKAAVRPAAATIIHRRVRLIRWSAASRSRAGSSRGGMPWCRAIALSCPVPLREK
jgi:hypothetical protein